MYSVQLAVLFNINIVVTAPFKVHFSLGQSSRIEIIMSRRKVSKCNADVDYYKEVDVDHNFRTRRGKVTFTV